MKETFYLRHDYNSRNDERVLKLRRKYPNGEGYGCYWMILEKLAESSEGRLRLVDVDDIAFDLHMDSKRITDVIQMYSLFENDQEYFWSNRLLSDLKEREEKSKKAVLANKVRWDKERNKLQTDSRRTPRKGKERKGEEKKGEESGEINSPTPSKKMLSFINLVEKKGSQYDDMIKQLSEKANLEDFIIQAELEKFVSYWCELNKSGTKQRWQIEKTFEVQRRFEKWISNSRTFNKGVEKKPIRIIS